MSEPQAAPPGSERLQKVLAERGVASRRAAEALIAEGRVRVNGVTVREMGTRVDPLADRLEVDGRLVALPTGTMQYVLLNKPLGIVSTARDPQGRPTVLSLVPGGERLYPVGRLDLDSEGLLLLTNDGELTYRLTQARVEVEKEYHVLVDGGITVDQLQDLREGVQLDDGWARPVRAGVVSTARAGTWLGVVLHEGRKREVRRMLAAVGLRLLRLQRVRIGPLELGGLASGEHRSLAPREIRALRACVGLELAQNEPRRIG